MAILGKDLLDLHRPRTNTRVEFGASCYWVESAPNPQPYGAILTEVLNLGTEPFQHLLDKLTLVIQQRDFGTAPHAYTEMQKGFGSLPLYRLYWEDFRACGDMEAEDFAVGGVQEAFAEFVVDRGGSLPSFMQQQLDDIRFIQKRYSWFLDTLSAGRVFEKKKGQRKEPLAEQLDERGLGAFISGVSLGESPETDPPQVRSQYRLRGQGREAEIVERMYFVRLLDFVYVEFMKGIQKGFVPKRCANCGRWFLQTPGATYSYCDGPAPGQEGKTCREIGATASFQDKVRNNEIWKIHQRAYKKYFARTRKGTMSRTEFDLWAREAEQLRDQALAAYEGTAAGKTKAEIADRLKQKLNQN
jgi:hypothetical protein